MIDHEKLIETNSHLLFILGASMPILLGARLTEREEYLRKWIIEATESVVYRNQGLPPFEIG